MSVTSLGRYVPGFLRPADDSLWRQMQRTSANPRLHLLNFLWSLWALATLFFAPQVNAAFWWSLGISYPIFTVLFALIHVRPHGEIRIYAGMIAFLAFVSMLWNPAAWSYAVFACVYTGMASVQSPRSGVLRIIMIEGVLVALAWWLNWPWFIMVMAVCVCTSSGLGAMFGYISQAKNLELRNTHEEVRRLAAAKERERIGRDLHDLLGHTLSLITLKLELSRRLFDRDHEAARRELEEAEKVARQALAEVRAAVTGIRATDLAAELASAQVMLKSSGVALECSDTVPDLPQELERNLALILREAVTNVVRHAGGRVVKIELDAVGGNVRLSVTDDGRGGITTGGNGLNGMRERVRAVDGVLRIDSPRGRGTRLEVLAPLRSLQQVGTLLPVAAESTDEDRFVRLPVGMAGHRA